MDGRGAQGRRDVNSHLLWRPVNRSRPAELMVDALARRPSPAALCALDLGHVGGRVGWGHELHKTPYLPTEHVASRQPNTPYLPTPLTCVLP